METELQALAERLKKEAARVISHAYAPHSHFRVAAAALPEGSERIFVGVNLESDSYGATLCAERVALGAMVTAGHHRLRAVLVLTEGEQPAPPCGICRQLISELSQGKGLVFGAARGKLMVWRIGELLPHPFRLREEE